MTTRMSMRSFGAFCSVLGLTTLSMVAGGPVASASASGCVDEGNTNSSCIRIHGSGLHVDWIQPGSLVAPFRTMRGSFTVSDSAGLIDKDTKSYTYKSYSPLPVYMWGDRIKIDKNFPHNDKVCVTLHDGVYHPPACKTIHR
ncbi:hypothetical protein [Allokutzneria oryzae]|uniref:Uncharacterized protein n=1 Tax=Allokutzneria oryzae TaxID=1378989 RepID=A0ABV5ZZ75_9PSEU